MVNAPRSDDVLSASQGGSISRPDGLTHDLITRCQRGEDHALNLLASLSFRTSYRWALTYTGSPDEAEDIAQQVVIKACSSVATFRFAAKYTTWLYRLTRRTVADRFRLRRRREQLIATREIPAPAAASPELSSLAAFVAERLTALPARQREVFDLVDLQGYSAAEVAATLELQESTVRVHLLRARRALRERVLAERRYTYEEVANEL